MFTGDTGLWPTTYFTEIIQTHDMTSYYCNQPVWRGCVWNPFGQPLTTVNHEQPLTTIIMTIKQSKTTIDSHKQTVTAVYSILTAFSILVSLPGRTCNLARTTRCEDKHSLFWPFTVGIPIIAGCYDLLLTSSSFQPPSLAGHSWLVMIGHYEPLLVILVGGSRFWTVVMARINTWFIIINPRLSTMIDHH